MTTPSLSLREQAPWRAIVDFFERLAPEDVARIGDVYASQARFKDPFNEIVGPDAIGRVFAHMFEQLENPRFVVRDCVGDATQAFLTWDFLFRRRADASTDWRIHGASHLRLDEHGRIVWHRDYWDTGEELYAKVPVLGALMRWLRRRAAA